MKHRQNAQKNTPNVGCDSAHTHPRKKYRSIALSLVLVSALSGCYVVPIHPPSPPRSDYPGTVYTTPAPVLSVPAPILTTPAPSQYTARLYPVNDEASKVGPLTAQINDAQTGRGTFTVMVKNENLSGEMTRVANDSPVFGRILNTVLSTQVRTNSYSIRGIANGTGSRGSYIQCEYILSSSAGAALPQGTGACLLNKEAKFQMHFGG